MNTYTNSVQEKAPTVKQQHDAINLARSKGEYIPKVTQNEDYMLKLQSPKAKQMDRPLDEVMLWA